MSDCDTTTDTAGVLARPPRVMLGFLLAGGALDLLAPGPALPEALRFAAGPALAALGVGLMTAAMGRFRRADTPVETCRTTRALVTEGPFAWSRNPIYLAGLLLYIGIALVAGPWTLALAVPFWAVLRYGVIAREERYLAARFGDAYAAYRATVPRWLGPPRSGGARPAPETRSGA